MKGIIKTIVQDKGFGFISVEGREKDLFFHAKNCNCDFKELKQGDEVYFNEIATNDKGDSAMGVDFS